MRSAVSSLLLLAVGAVIGSLFVLYRYSGLQLDNKINLLDLVNVLLTLLIALIVNGIYERSASTNAMRRQLLLDHVKDIGTKLDEAYHAFLECPIGAKLSKEVSEKISGSERHFSNSLHALEVALGVTRIKPGKHFAALKESKFLLKKLMTDSPFPNGPYDSKRYSKILREFNRVREQTTSVLFEINESCR